MQHRQVFPLKAINYAASKGSATQNTALNPADLADGAVGIYGVHKTGSTNLNKLVLITDGGSEVAGAVPMATFVGTSIVIGVGKAVGCELSRYIEKPSGLIAAVAQKYTAPVLGVWRIGYNGTAGTSFNLPGTIIKGDDFSISVVEKNFIVSGNREPYLKKNYAVTAATGDTNYTLAKKWIAYVQSLPADQLLFDKAKVKLLDNTAGGAAFTNSATVAAVNGATSLTTSAAHGVGVADYVRLDGDYYQAITGTTGSTLVLDRPYQGATATIANAATVDLGATIATAFGIEIVDKAAGQNLFVASDGILSDAVRKQQTAPLLGSGTQSQVAALELEALPKKGTDDFIHTYVKKDTIKASGTYDLYIHTIQNSNNPKGEDGSVFKVLSYLTLAFVSDTADTINFAQSDFEDIMTTLFGSTYPAISA